MQRLTYIPFDDRLFVQREWAKTQKRRQKCLEIKRTPLKGIATNPPTEYITIDSCTSIRTKANVEVNKINNFTSTTTVHFKQMYLLCLFGTCFSPFIDAVLSGYRSFRRENNEKKHCKRFVRSREHPRHF